MKTGQSLEYQGGFKLTVKIKTKNKFLYFINK